MAALIPDVAALTGQGLGLFTAGGGFAKPNQNSASRSDAFQAGVLANPSTVFGSDFNVVGGGPRGASAQTAGASLQGGSPFILPSTSGPGIAGSLNSNEWLLIGGLALVGFLLLRKGGKK